MSGVDTEGVARDRSEGRSALGVTGSSERVRLLDVARGPLGFYPLVALCLLAVGDQLGGYAFFVLGPEIGRALGVGRSTLVGLSAIRLLCVFAATLPMAAFVQEFPRRASVALASAFGSIGVMVLVGTSPDVGTLTLAWALGGVLDGAVASVQRPLLLDSFAPTGRVRVLAIYRVATQAAGVLGPFLVALLTKAFDLTWRGVFIAIAGLMVPTALYATRLRDPGFGTFDEAVLRDRARARLDAQGTNASRHDPDDDVGLGFFEIVRRLFQIPTIRRLLVGWAALGLTFTPLLTYVSFFLEERWGLTTTGRALFLPVLPFGSIVVLALASRRTESDFSVDPARLLRRAGRALAAGAVLIGASVLIGAGRLASAGFVAMAALMGLGFGLFSFTYPLVEAAQLSIVPTRMRPHTSALAGLFAAGVGGAGGIVLLGSIDRRFGVGGAIITTLIPALIAAAVISSAAKLINNDLDKTVDALVEEEELKARRMASEHLSLLAVRNVDFSYATVQVLFGVDFTIDDGEVVALLGTNGAGKSTLLRVISGLALPQRGSVRLAGADITFVDAERRVGLGISEISGGKAVFGPLSVVENLRLFGYSLGREATRVNEGIEATFAAFPRLAERKEQPAQTLSGGEQQMLALGKALILQPRLLCIDELSLGLAPVVVGGLLQMVRSINATGTAVVLVEQSVNVALSIAQRAYFMEKGEVRFDGSAADLAGRTDLLRAVFLEGTASAIATSGITK